MMLQWGSAALSANGQDPDTCILTYFIVYTSRRATESVSRNGAGKLRLLPQPAALVSGPRRARSIRCINSGTTSMSKCAYFNVMKHGISSNFVKLMRGRHARLKYEWRGSEVQQVMSDRASLKVSIANESYIRCRRIEIFFYALGI